MAKKRKKEKKHEEEYEFKPPEFNEREFLEKELRDTRAAIVTVGIAVLFGVLAGVITALGHALVGIGFLVGVAGIFLLKFLYNLVGVDVSGFTRRNWAGTVVTYFFTFLAIWVLLMNTPFVDLTEPNIDRAIVWVSDGTNLTGIEYKKLEKTGALTWIRMDNNATPEGLIHTSSSYTINITARIADSGGIALAEIAFNSSNSAYFRMAKGSSGKFEYSMNCALLAPEPGQAPRGNLLFFIHASDEHGNERSFAPSPIPLSP